jgi:hypothetical protein
MTRQMGEINGSFKHGNRNVDGKTTPEYHAWRNLKKRCANRNCKDFPNWGGRGIKVCDEWLHDFQAFLDHVGPRPSPQHTIDRIDNERHYEPGNVRWATRTEQAHNSRATKLDWEKVRQIRKHLAAGETQQSIGELFGVNQRTISLIKLNRIWAE